jgi:3'-5' exonuclease
VNTFDTFHAAKTLKYPALSLAHLLKYHGNIKLNKKHQLSDWRQRPLPQDMIDYARCDTAYLHFLYDSMRRDIYKIYGREGIEAVLNASRKWCLKRYEKEPFWPLGYRKLISSEGCPPGASTGHHSTASSSSSSSAGARLPPPTLSAAQDLVLAGISLSHTQLPVELYVDLPLVSPLVLSSVPSNFLLACFSLCCPGSGSTHTQHCGIGVTSLLERRTRACTTS